MLIHLATRLMTFAPAKNPGVNPNDDGLPGLGVFKHLVGALLTYGLIACVAGVAISAILWAVGGSSSNPQLAQRGKNGVVAAVCAALLIGAANVLVGFFNDAGGQV